MSPRSGENVPVNSQASHQSRPRRSHGKVLAPIADSSEDEPSPHSSIFEAPLASDSENEGIGSSANKRSPNAVVEVTREVVIAENINVGQDDRSSVAGGADASIGSQLEYSRSGSSTSDYPHGRYINTLSQGLDTIVEQKSSSTLREEDSAFQRLSRRSSTEFSEDDEDEDDCILLPRGRRKKNRGDCFDYYDDELVYDYVSPSQPLYQSISALHHADSPLSPATPPLGDTPPISASFFNRNYSPSNPLRAPLQGPTFRPPTSGYRSYGTLTNHPFHNAPIARSDRGEGSSRGVGRPGYLATGVSTPDSLRSPRQGRSRAGSVSDGSGRGLMNKWKLSTICGIFCCLARTEEE
ncbi:hypothetical protein BDZ91DRAFT_714479 [Kalaharituber pfeilii]|nr:hypothetical protein BDZ91DRAFT_714479 [Kalaharituber pfeilii]